ncbi:hypothetical protein SAMN05421797_102272 [Maribacter ulvicola]|uniref:Uncharacterized protein n=1 Tax=Maribacter ulvicola TaxID=228959 RepID=A0A1N6UB06_9FLAO|nr:hypothetical protein SAMN05421797_102272 [Maribacter ulvicola]
MNKHLLKGGKAMCVEWKSVLKTLFTLRLSNKIIPTKFIIFKFYFSYNNDQLLNSK